MQRVMPQPSFDQQTWCGVIRPELERLAHFTGRLSTDLPMPDGGQAAAASLRLSIVGAILPLLVVVVSIVSAAFDFVGPVRIGVGGSVILGLAYLQQLCAPAELGRNLAVIPALRSRRARVLRLAEVMIDAVTITLLYAAGCSLIGWSMVKLLGASA